MSESYKSILGKAVITILKPLLRVLIRNEITVADFAELCRQAYVDVAYEHFRLEGRKLTHARIAVLTGLSRKEVKRLSELRESQGLQIKATPNRAQRVVNGWISDSEFMDSNGQANALPLQGEKASFAALVARYSGDITLGAILDELIRIGVVSRDESDVIRLLALGYVPQADELEKIGVMATCAADLLDTAVHNIDHGKDDPKFQRQVVYPRLSSEAVARFREQSAELSASYLQQLNRLLAKAQSDESTVDESTVIEHSADDDKSAPHYRRVGFGIYYFDGPATPEKSTDKSQDKKNSTP